MYLTIYLHRMHASHQISQNRCCHFPSHLSVRMTLVYSKHLSRIVYKYADTMLGENVTREKPGHILSAYKFMCHIYFTYICLYVFVLYIPQCIRVTFSIKWRGQRTRTHHHVHKNLECIINIFFYFWDNLITTKWRRVAHDMTFICSTQSASIYAYNNVYTCVTCGSKRMFSWGGNFLGGANIMRVNRIINNEVRFEFLMNACV